MACTASELVIPIREGHIGSIVRVIDKRSHEVGYMHTVELAALLLNQSTSTEATRQLPWMDLLASHGIASYRKLDGEAGVIAVFPATTRTITCATPTVAPFSVTVPLPTVIWFARWNAEGRVDKSYMMATPDTPVGLAQPCRLFHFALGNVDQHGKVCWGTAQEPSQVPLGDITRIHEMFFTSRFNSDLSINFRFPMSKKWVSSVNGASYAKANWPDLANHDVVPELTFEVKPFFAFQDWTVTRQMPLEAPFPIPKVERWGPVRFPTIQALANNVFGTTATP